MKKILLSLAFLLTAMTAAAQDDGMFCYAYNDATQTATVTYYVTSDGSKKGGTYTGDVIIPAKAPNGYTVTTIGEDAFRNSSGMTSLTIPTTVDSIGPTPFLNCKARLKKITIEDSDRPLRCSIVDRWPMGVWTVFGKEVSVEDIYIGRRFNVDFERGWVEVAGAYSYSIVYNNATLKTATLGSVFDEVPNGAFKDCKGLRLVSFSPNTKRIGKEAFAGCDTLNTMRIPEGVEVIDTLAFSSCDSLLQVTLPATLKLIRTSAFLNCKQLKEMSIPASVDSIGAGVFDSCDGLRHFVVENGNTPLRLWSQQWWGGVSTLLNALPNLESVSMGRPIVCDYPLTYRCRTLRSFHYSYPADEVADNQFYECDSLRTVTFLQWPSRIGKYAFYRCASLERIDLPEGVTLIDEGAFSLCTALEHVGLPRSLRVIAAEAFNRCKAFRRFTIPAQVDSIGANILVDCENLKRIDIAYSPNPLKYTCPSQFNNSLRSAPIDTLYMDRYIDGYFSDNRTVKTLYVGPNVTAIKNEIFSNCYNINEVYSLNPVPPTCEGGSVFYSGTKKEGQLHVPAGSVDAYKAAFVWQDFFSIDEQDVDAMNIKGQMAGAATVNSAYTLSGQRATDSHRGLTIQRMSDGTTRKVFSNK